METLVLSVGGSIISPDKPDYFFLKEFKNFVIKNLDKYKFIIVTGGGKTNFYYNEAAKRVSKITDEDLDWLGIAATRLNAELLRIIFGDSAYSKVIYNPNDRYAKALVPLIRMELDEEIYAKVKEGDQFE